MAEVKKYVDQTGLKRFAELLKGKMYVKSEVDALIAAINKFDVVVAATLPTASADTMYHIYLVSKGEGKTGYSEYITVRSIASGTGTEEDPYVYSYTWEEIGDTEVDLSNYVQKEENKGLISTAVAGQLSANAEGITSSKDLTVGEDLITNGAEHIVLGEDETLQDALDTKVDAVDGSRLMTDAEGTKLAGIAEGANTNVIESVKVNGVALTPDADKAVDVTVPTKVTDLTLGEAISYEIEGQQPVEIAGADDTTVDAINGVLDQIVANEKVTAGALTALDDKINGLDTTASLTDDEVEAAFNQAFA